jgi:hypothetical protein
MDKIKDYLPIGLLLPFMMILAFEGMLIYGGGFYKQSLSNKISNLETSLNSREEENLNKLTKNETYFVFSQAVNIVEILKERKDIIKIVNRFNSLMPKFLRLDNFTFNSSLNTISFSGSVQGWDNFFKFKNYLVSENKYFSGKIESGPNYNEGTVNFSAVISLKPDFYQ